MNNIEKVIDIKTRERFIPIEGKVKLRKDGEKKGTPNNNSKNRFVEPIRSKEDIQKIKDYWQGKIDNEENILIRKEHGRNKLLFCIGINLGIRVSDLLKLRWNNFFCKDMKSFRKRDLITEQKTGKGRGLYFNSSVENAIIEYLDRFNISPEPDDYLFTNIRRSRDGKFHVITDERVSQIIKECIKACGIEGNYATHSLRKTYAYHLYMLLIEQGDSLALPKVQKILNHRNQSETLRYLGLQFKMEKQINDELCL